MKCTILGIDVAKNVFQLHGVNKAGIVVWSIIGFTVWYGSESLRQSRFNGPARRPTRKRGGEAQPLSPAHNTGHSCSEESLREAPPTAYAESRWDTTGGVGPRWKL